MDSAVLQAIAEPTRLRIVELLRGRSCSVSEVADQLNLRQPQASKHLKRLTKAGVLAMTPAAQQHVYSLNQEPFLQLHDWLNSFERYWSNKFLNLDEYLNNVKKG